MASFIYFYSKFTDEFLLLTASAMFGLLGFYCYHWAMNRRRLGSSPRMVPASVVKEYLNQLINEAQFIRTQLFGILSGAGHADGSTDALFNQILAGRGSNHHASAQHASSDHTITEGAGVPQDLLERLKALEGQLAEKEGMIVNVNIEKTRLLQDLETAKNAAKSGTGTAPAANNEDLLKRLKTLEQQLEEYNMFEDDLANIKRIQQENDQLKRKIEEMSAYSNAAPAKPAAVSPPTGATPDVDLSGSKAPSLDQASIAALLDGESAVAPTDPKAVAATEAPMASVAPVAEIAVAQAAAPTPTTEGFDSLASSIENSLTPPEAAAPAAEPAPAAPVALAAAPEPAPAADSSKSDEELLKEFENLLNSG